MKHFPNKIKIYHYSSLILALIDTALYAASLHLDFDVPIGYFDGGVLPYLAKYALILSVAWILSFLIYAPKDEMPDTFPGISAFSFTASVFAAAATAAAFAIRVISPGEKPVPKFFTLISVLLLCSASFFVLNLVCGNTKQRLKASCRVLNIVAAAALIAEAYTDRFVQMNSPLKLLLMFALLSVMFVSVYEAECLVSDRSSKTFPAFNLISVVLNGAFSVPFLILQFTGKYMIVEFMPAAFFSLAQFVYGISRACDFLHASRKNENIGSEEVRSEEVRSAEVRSEEVRSEEVRSEETGNEKVGDEEVGDKETEVEKVRDEEVGDEKVRDEEVGGEKVRDEEVGDEKVGVEKDTGGNV